MKQIILIAALLAAPNFSSADIRDDWQMVADSMVLAGQEAAAEQLREAIQTISDEELQLVYGDANLVGLANAFVESSEAIAAAEAMGYHRASQVPPGLTALGEANSSDFPDASGYPSSPLCPYSPDRSNADALLIAVDAIQLGRVGLEVGRGIWALSDRACNTVAVVAGNGGNPQSTTCIVADIILFTLEAVVGLAQATVDHIAFCDAAVDSAEIEGAYDRAGHIHSDLATHDKEIKEQLDRIEAIVLENQRLIKITMSRQLEVMRMSLVSNGNREINSETLTCTGNDCPVFPTYQLCPNGSLKWNCRN